MSNPLPEASPVAHGYAPERAGAGKVIANFILNDLKGMLSKRKLTIEQCPIAPEVIGFLGRAVAAGLLSKEQMRKLVLTWMDEAQSGLNSATGSAEKPLTGRGA